MRRRRPRLSARFRRGVFAAGILALLAGNAWVVRRQFPPAERRKNEAYDEGLRALDVERDFSRAEVEFRRFLEVDPRHRRVRVLLAMALKEQGKAAEARAEYLAVLEQDPQFAEARVGLAELAQSELDYEEAFRQLELARAASDPVPTPVHLLTARLLVEMGDHDAALAAYRRAVAADAGCYEGFLSLGDLLVSRALTTGSAQDRSAGAAMYRTAEQICRGRMGPSGDKRLGLSLAKAIAGQARIAQDRELSEAVEQIERVIALDPEDPEPTLVLGTFFRNAGDRVEARRVLEGARRRWSRRPDVALALFDLELSDGDAAKATAVLEEAIRENPEDVGLRVRLVGQLAGTDRVDEAAAEVRRLRVRFDGDFRAHEAEGDLARELARRAAREGRLEDESARHQEALAAYRRAHDLRPRSPRLAKKLAGELIAVVALRGPDAEPGPEEELARRCIEDVLRVNPRDAEALAWRARMLLADGREAEAQAALRPLLERSDAPVDALRLLGAASARVGDESAAADAFLRVVERLAPRNAADRREDPRAAPAGDWADAASAALRAGRHDAALRLAREARDAWPESVRLRAVLARAHLAAQDVRTALVELEAACAEFPGDVECRLLRARALEGAGRIDEARRAIEAAVVDLPGETTRLAWYEFLARTGSSADAEAGFLELVGAAPTSPAAWLRLGDFYTSLRPPRDAQALEAYARALELVPEEPAPLVRMAEVHLRTADRDPRALLEARNLADRYEAAAPADAFVDYLRGKLALVGGDAEGALPRLERFAKARPDVSAGLYYLSRALRAVGRLEEAVEPLERAARLSPRDAALKAELAATVYDLGLAAFRAGRFDDARHLLARAASGGAGREARFLVAGAAANVGLLDVSERECRELIAQRPDDDAAVQLLAALLLARGGEEALAEAERLQRTVLARDPENLVARAAIGTVKFRRGLAAEALADFRAVYPRTDGNPMIALAIAQCMAADNDAAGALEFLRGEEAARPTDYAFPHLQGDFLVSMRRHEDAVRAFLRAYELNPDDHVALLAAAAALVETRRHEQARRLLVERLPDSLEPALLHLALGDVLFAMGRAEEAREELRKAIALAPGHPRALLLLGKLAEHAGDLGEARRLYREAVERQAPDPEAYVRLAQLLAGDGQRREAADLYAAALRLDPSQPAVLNNLALLLSEQEGQLERAVELAERAHRLSPDQPLVGDTYGWLLVRSGRAADAATLLERCAAQLPRDAVVQYHAGIALVRLRRATDARLLLERALRISSSFEGADTARAELEKLR